MELISVYNSSGSLINKFAPGSGMDETKINCSNYPTGLYFVKIETKNGSIVTKLIKK
jgi:hypothetical protein